MSGNGIRGAWFGRDESDVSESEISSGLEGDSGENGDGPHTADSPSSPEEPARGHVEVEFLDCDQVDFSRFSNLLESCIVEIDSSVDRWKTITGPIAEELVERYQSKSADDPFDGYAIQVHALISGVTRTGEEAEGAIFRVFLKIHTPEVVDAIREGRTRDLPPVDLNAWSCFLWFWGGYRRHCKEHMEQFQSILEDWDTWAWPTSLARAEGLKFVAYLIKRGVEANPLLARREWSGRLQGSNPCAHDWFYAPMESEIEQ